MRISNCSAVGCTASKNRFHFRPGHEAGKSRFYVLPTDRFFIWGLGVRGCVAPRARVPQLSDTSAGAQSESERVYFVCVSVCLFVLWRCCAHTQSKRRPRDRQCRCVENASHLTKSPPTYPTTTKTQRKKPAAAAAAHDDNHKRRASGQAQAMYKTRNDSSIRQLQRIVTQASTRMFYGFVGLSIVRTVHLYHEPTNRQHTYTKTFKFLTSSITRPQKRYTTPSIRSHGVGEPNACSRLADWRWLSCLACLHARTSVRKS